MTNMNPMNGAMATTTGAAARVVAIPELLEHILIMLACDRPLFRTFSRQSKTIESHFLLQRTNSTFRSVIEGSKTLRMMMGIEHCSDSNFSAESDGYRRLFPTRWLLHNFWCHAPTCWDDDDGSEVQTFHCTIQSSDMLDFELWQRSGHMAIARKVATADASWRRIKLACADFTKPTVLRVVVETAPSRDGDCLYCSHEYRISLDSERTLGDLHDLVHKFMARSTRDLRILSHLEWKHHEFGLDEIVELCSTAPLAADKALDSYNQLRNEAFMEHGNAWIADTESWKYCTRNILERDCPILTSCALCKKTTDL